MEAKLFILYEDEKMAEAVLEALSPDNVVVPSSLSIEAFSKNNQVVVVIKYRGENFLTLQSTIDDLLSCVSVAEKSIIALNKGRRIRYSKEENE